MPRFWNFIKNEISKNNVELRIDGDIVADSDAWIYEYFGEPASSPNAFRNELAQYANDDLTVWINSNGGDVFAAIGIYDALKNHKGKVITKVEVAMSAASVIAMAGDEIQMSPIGIMMIHNPLSGVRGYASDMRKQADVLDVVKETIINAYVSKTKKSAAKISAMMDDETFMSVKDAIKNGFADSVLFQEETDEENISNFSFNRTAIVNSANESMKSLIKFSSTHNIKNDSSDPYPNDASSPTFNVGDRVGLTIPPHMEGHTTGEIREAVLTWVYGIVFDGMEDMGIHHWYVESELKSADTQQTNDEEIDDAMEDKKKKKMPDMPGMENKKQDLLMELDLI